MPYGKRSSRQRPHDAASSSRAPSIERQRARPCRPLRPEREDGTQMAQADHNGRRAHGSEDAEEHGADAGRGSHRGCVPAEDAAATGRCARLPEGRHPQSQPQRPASLPAAPWRLPPSSQGDTGAPQEVQDLRDRLRHIDSCELRRADGKLVMFLAIDRVSKFTYVEFHDSAGKMEGSAFLKVVVEVFPYKIHTVLTENGMAFADLPKNREGPSRRFLGPHIFDRICMANGIEHRLTKPYHPWTNGQAERMNRTIKDATIKTYHYDDLENLKAHVMAFVTAYNFAKHLKALKWRTPYQVICEAWTKDPSIFKLNPRHLIPRPHRCVPSFSMPIPYPATDQLFRAIYNPPSTLGNCGRGCLRNRSEFGARRESRCHRSSAMGNGSMLTPAHHEGSSPYRCSSR
jgi:hypothetical protein